MILNLVDMFLLDREFVQMNLLDNIFLLDIDKLCNCSYLYLDNNIQLDNSNKMIVLY